MKKQHIITIDAEQCIGCGQCKKDCPAHNIVVEDKKARVLAQSCIMCGHCVAICPKAAVSISGFDEPPIELEPPITVDSEQLLKAIRARRSIRHFTNNQVSKEIVEKIIEAGRMTPTGKNAQDVSYIVLRNRIAYFERMAVNVFKSLLPIAKLVMPMARRIAIDDNFFFKKAPLVIAIVSKDKINASLAASNMALMAEACGLGVLYSGFFSIAVNVSGAMRKQLKMKRGEKVVTTLVLGYPDVKYYRTAQKETADIREF